MSDVFFRPLPTGGPFPAPAERVWLTALGIGIAFFLFGGGLRIGILPPIPQALPAKVVTRVVSTPVPKKAKSHPPVTKRPPVRSGRVDPAIRKAFLAGHLDRAEELLGGGSGVSRGLAAEIRYARCRRAVLRGEWGIAVHACEEATKKWPHPRARRLLSWLSDRARKRFLEGYAMERIDPEGALRKYREALSCAPSDSPYRVKAAARLKGEVRSETLSRQR